MTVAPIILEINLPEVPYTGTVKTEYAMAASEIIEAILPEVIAGLEEYQEIIGKGKK